MERPQDQQSVPHQAYSAQDAATISSMLRPNPTELPPEAIDLATKLFNAARAGETHMLAQYITAGIPANLTNHDGATLLMLAAYHGHAVTVRMLLTHGADPNARNLHGQTPLAGAVFKGYGEVVKVLVVEGLADVWAGQPSAVDTARLFKRVDLLAMMGIMNGADDEPPVAEQCHQASDA